MNDDVEDYKFHKHKYRKDSIQDMKSINDNYMMIKNEYYSQEDGRVSTPKYSKDTDALGTKEDKSISLKKRNSNIFLYHDS